MPLVTKLPEGPQWLYEVKQDGHRAEALIDGNTVALHSMAGLSFNDKFPAIVEALKWLRLKSAVLVFNLTSEQRRLKLF